MNIAFVYPECENIGIEYLSACLKKSGHSVKLIFDPMLFGSYYFNSTILKKTFSYNKYVVKEILRANYDLVCFSVFSDYYGWACGLASEIKKNNGATKIIFGGIHPSAVPEHLILKPFIDYVCVGEGEDVLVELANCLERKGDVSHIRNIWAKEGKKVIQNEVRPLIADLDSLPFPDKSIFSSECKSFVNSVYSIITSRGCPNECTYCYNSYYKRLYKGKGVYLRRRSVDNVIEELLYAKSLFDFKRVAFFDDLFVYDLQWLKEFSAKYKKNIKLPYFCHVHPAYINKESIDLLRYSGCATVTMGIQTIDSKIRRNVLARKESNGQIRSAIQLISKSGIFLYTNIIFGLPLQDEGVMSRDVRFSNLFRVDIPASNWLRYYPKTRIIDVARQHGLLSEDEIERIEKGEEYLPYSIKGNTYNKIGARLRNMLLLTHLLPRPVVKYIMKHKVYRMIPEFNFRFYVELLMMARRNIFTARKVTFVYLSFWDIAKFYFHYIIKKIRHFKIFLPVGIGNNG